MNGVCSLLVKTTFSLSRFSRLNPPLYASINSEVGDYYFAKVHAINQKDKLDTMLLVQNDMVYTKSTAFIRCYSHVMKIKLIKIMLLVPQRIRDFIYDLIASKRYYISSILNLRPSFKSCDINQMSKLNPLIISKMVECELE